MRNPSGYHLVKLFSYDGDETELPPGWKPYADVLINGTHKIAARLWVRYDDVPEKVDAVAWAEATTREAASVGNRL